MTKKLAVLSIFAALSWAGTVTTTGTFGGGDPETALPFPGGSYIAVDAFDTNLGTLTGITLTLEGTASNVTYSLKNDDVTTATLMDNSRGGALMHLFAPVGSGIQLAMVFPALVIPKGDPALTIDPGQTVSVGPGSTSESDPDNVVPVGIWGLFSNNGPCIDCVQMPIDGVGYYSLSASGGTLTPTVSGSGSALVTVVYTYNEPVPEPAMLTLVGGGLLGLGFVARRRKKA